jgi:hypothetical protein
LTGEKTIVEQRVIDARPECAGGEPEEEDRDQENRYEPANDDQ